MSMATPMAASPDRSAEYPRSSPVTSTGPLIAGLLVGYFGGFTQGAAIMTCFALLSIVAMFLGRETKEAPLPLFEVAADAKQAD